MPAFFESCAPASSNTRPSNGNKNNLVATRGIGQGWPKPWPSRSMAKHAWPASRDPGHRAGRPLCCPNARGFGYVRVDPGPSQEKQVGHSEAHPVVGPHSNTPKANNSIPMSKRLDLAAHPLRGGSQLHHSLRWSSMVATARSGTSRRHRADLPAGVGEVSERGPQGPTSLAAATARRGNKAASRRADDLIRSPTTDVALTRTWKSASGHGQELRMRCFNSTC